MSELADEATVAILDALCRQTVNLVGAAPAALQHVRVHIGDIGVELDWAPEWPAEGGSGESADQKLEARITPIEAGPLDSDCQFICAPTVGAFYRRPEPGSVPFVEPDDVVEAGQQVGILEAMKLMNPIVAEVACRIVVILAVDGVTVEHGQPLFTVEPC
jgi:acetyl-CoA carboxylase biotin carboxyl carrier protein